MQDVASLVFKPAPLGTTGQPRRSHSTQLEKPALKAFAPPRTKSKKGQSQTNKKGTWLSWLVLTYSVRIIGGSNQQDRRR